MLLWEEPRRVAIGLDERVCNRPLGQSRHLAENVTHRCRVQIPVGARIEHRVETENLEQVELEVSHVRSVMAHRLSPRVAERQRIHARVEGAASGILS